MGDAQGAGGVLRRVSIKVHQADGGGLVQGQQVDLVADEDGQSIGAGRFDIRGGGLVPGEVLRRPLAPQMVDQDAARESTHPDPEAVEVAQGGQTPAQAEEDLLGEVVGCGVIATQGSGQVALDLFGDAEPGGGGIGWHGGVLPLQDADGRRADTGFPASSLARDRTMGSVRIMRIAAHIAAVLLALAFLAASLMYFLNLVDAPPPPEGSPIALFMGAMYPTGYLDFVKALELIGAILVALPWTRRVGLLILGPILVNILAFHVFLADGEGLGNPMILGIVACSGFLLWVDRRHWWHFLASREPA